MGVGSALAGVANIHAANLNPFNKGSPAKASPEPAPSRSAVQRGRAFGPMPGTPQSFQAPGARSAPKGHQAAFKQHGGYQKLAAKLGQNPHTAARAVGAVYQLPGALASLWARAHGYYGPRAQSGALPPIRAQYQGVPVRLSAYTTFVSPEGGVLPAGRRPIRLGGPTADALALGTAQTPTGQVIEGYPHAADSVLHELTHEYQRPSLLSRYASPAGMGRSEGGAEALALAVGQRLLGSQAMAPGAAGRWVSPQYTKWRQQFYRSVPGRGIGRLERSQLAGFPTRRK